MQSVIFRAFICYNFDYYSLQLYENLITILLIITKKGLKYLILHASMVILFSPFKLNY